MRFCAKWVLEWNALLGKSPPKHSMMVYRRNKLQQIPASDRSMLLSGGEFLTGVLFIQSPEATLTPGISGRN